jgi:uncharacterized membrane protein
MFEKPPFTEAEERQIIQAIEEAERLTSGEVRVHIDKKCAGDAYQEAVKRFERLGMTRTKERNGVLIFVALDDHKFSIIGDKGIYELVSKDFWDSTKAEMANQFRQGKIVEGIVAGIDGVGRQLKHFFPFKKSDENELKDDISYGA